MKKYILFFIVFSLITLYCKGQVYHSDDKEGLRAFLRQSSAVSGQINAQQLGLQLSDTLNWHTQEFWVSKVIGLVWSESSPKRLKKIGSVFGYEWNNKFLAGGMNCGKWQELEQLFCSNNQLKTIDVNSNSVLQYLYCEYNLLTALDVKNCIDLKDLICQFNLLQTIDVSANTQLGWLIVGGNQLTTLDVTNNKFLGVLSCEYNQLVDLDVTNNSGLIRLACSGNQLTDLDLSNNSLIQALFCSNNQIVNLDISNLRHLYYLYCDSNQLTTLDVAANISLEWLHCENNLLKKLIGVDIWVTDLICTHNQLPFSQVALRPKPFNYCPQNTINGGNIDYLSNIDLSSEYSFNGFITQFRWLDVTDGYEQPIELVGEYGIFYCTKDMIGKRLNCKMTNDYFPEFDNNPIVYEITVTDKNNIAENIGIVKNITVYPNPTTGQIDISACSAANGELTIESIKLFDISGKELMKINATQKQITVDISHFSAGIYFLHVNEEIIKVVKK